MAKFEQSRWAESEFSRNFRDEADIYLPLRSQFIATVKSFYGHFFASKVEAKILDLGCGDGLFMEELLKSYSPAAITLVDGSAEMLQAARNRLAQKTNIDFINLSFQDLLEKKSLNRDFDFIYSSLAIHHLPFEDKKRLFAYIHDLLSPGGCFVHYDVVVPPSAQIENWYLELWRQWIKEHPNIETHAGLLAIPEEYKGNPDNIPDTLESQLTVLEDVGFKNIDCFFKYGIFSLFGGCK
jgi:tRNA (cmo5U34)-methyltransferase